MVSNATSMMKGKVYLMGTSSGDPDLLSSAAVRVLRAAEVVLHDDQVSPEILELVPASAQVRSVHKLARRRAVSRKKLILCSSRRRAMDITSYASGGTASFHRRGLTKRPKLWPRPVSISR